MKSAAFAGIIIGGFLAVKAFCPPQYAVWVIAAAILFLFVMYLQTRARIREAEVAEDLCEKLESGEHSIEDLPSGSTIVKKFKKAKRRERKADGIRSANQDDGEGE